MSRHDGWATYLDDPASLELPVGERDALDRIRGVLADSVTWEEPPAGFTARVLELAAAEAADPAMPPTPPRSPAGPGDADVPDADLRTVPAARPEPTPAPTARTGLGVLGGPARPLRGSRRSGGRRPGGRSGGSGPVVSGPAVPGPVIDSADSRP